MNSKIATVGTKPLSLKPLKSRNPSPIWNGKASGVAMPKAKLTPYTAAKIRAKADRIMGQ